MKLIESTKASDTRKTVLTSLFIEIKTEQKMTENAFPLNTQKVLLLSWENFQNLTLIKRSRFLFYTLRLPSTDKKISVRKLYRRYKFEHSLPMSFD